MSTLQDYDNVYCVSLGFFDVLPRVDFRQWADKLLVLAGILKNPPFLAGFF